MKSKDYITRLSTLVIVNRVFLILKDRCTAIFFQLQLFYGRLIFLEKSTNACCIFGIVVHVKYKLLLEVAVNKIPHDKIIIKCPNM